ncbi:transposase [Phycisphaera mikurensis]|uniref:Transposase IS200-like domain-containing protein n=1 Tax=Phycisphaera mikurensis (strain NBRC 102666 / KCTC 22515 / FYK2301M01) TaxID=1142394 RepID=I0ICJ6_PHYMF|nr:transposase [Phycisphaera mikurensis]MBB6442139.1 REP element-mobilizing transposase RayT [Phycisphaera mikurensis]BAM02984.1 hypothetical protein PSMK_08250 [Phycisphaera mikurensis NBRC 102666]
MARSLRHQILPDATCVVHVVSKISRSLHLLVPDEDRAGAGAVGDAAEHPDLRKELLMQRMQTLAEQTSISVCGFAVMDNHVHLILRRDKEEAAAWPAAEVVGRWLALHPKRNRARQPVETPEEDVAAMVADAGLVEALRGKLSSVSQFMKDLKQRTAEAVNKLEGRGGRLWDGTFKSKLIEDQEQLVATMVYVDLNPFAAGVCETPEEGRHTSLAGRLGRDEPAGEVSKPAGSADRDREEASEAGGPRVGLRLPRRRSSGAWLRPLDESAQRARKRGQRRHPRGRAGLKAEAAGTVSPGLSLQIYLRILDAVSRKLRAGKKRLAAGMASVFERLNLDADAVVGRVLAMAQRDGLAVAGRGS